jgi:hypothetical protein
VRRTLGACFTVGVAVVAGDAPLPASLGVLLPAGTQPGTPTRSHSKAGATTGPKARIRGKGLAERSLTSGLVP